MTDVFISYKREDEPRIAKLVQALEKAGLRVWWDKNLPGGENFRTNIDKALAAARCVIVAWSHGSVGDEGGFVIDEAEDGKRRNILVPVFLDTVTPPKGFGTIHAIDLINWNGDLGDPVFKDLVAACQAKINGTPAPMATGRVQWWRRIVWPSVAAAIITGAWTFFTNALGVADVVCRVPVAQPFIADTCGALWHAGNSPTKTERQAYSALPKGDCTALRQFRDKYENSPLRKEADSRLNARAETTTESWIPGSRKLALSAGGSNEAEARAFAEKRGALQCNSFAATTDYRAVGHQIDVTYGCEGAICAAEGHVICKTEERQVKTTETCGS